MNPSEHRIKSIPRQTMRNVWRKQRVRGITIIPSGEGLGGVSGERQSFVPTEGPTEREWIAKHVFQKPTGEVPRAPRIVYEDEGSIRWEVEINEGYNTQRDLGVILRIFGIDLGQGPFVKSRDNYGPDSAAFYSPIGYKGKQNFLILVTRGDILETQVVPRRIDETPFFREETLIPSLLTAYDPTSMAICQNNRLIIVSYHPRY